MKETYKASLAAFGLLSTLALTSQAAAREVYMPEPGKITIGWWDGDAYAMLESGGPNHCVGYRLGDDEDIWYTVHGTDESDEFYVVNFNQTVCGRPMTPLTAYSWLSIYGHGGDDIIFNGVHAGASLHGGDGDDLIVSTEPYGGGVYIWGEGDDDILFGNGYDYLYGGDGSDKLCVDGYASRIYGNTGADTYCGSAYAIDSASLSSSCPCSLF